MSRIAVGTKVKVKPAPSNSDVETSFYMSKYVGLVGTLVEIKAYPKGLRTFHVEFPKMERHGIFYENEIELVTD